MVVVSHLFLFYGKISGADVTWYESHLPLFGTIYFPIAPSCTFENGKKEQATTTTPAEFKEIYGQFGYNGEYDAQYYTPPEGKQAGGLSYSVTVGDYVIIGIAVSYTHLTLPTI